MDFLGTDQDQSLQNDMSLSDLATTFSSGDGIERDVLPYNFKVDMIPGQ